MSMLDVLRNTFQRSSDNEKPNVTERTRAAPFSRSSRPLAGPELDLLLVSMTPARYKQ